LSNFVFNFNVRANHRAVTLECDFAGLAVDIGTNIMVKPVFRTARLLNGFLHRDQNDFAVNIFLTRNGIGNL
jgi:hypothetical protein